MYYIYALMDIRTNLPFYIGKGKKSNSRHLDHFKESIDKNSNRHKFFKINYLQKLGLGIPVIILVDNIKDEIDAYELEISYILKYGRENIDAGGILVNILLNSRIPPSAKGKKQSNTHIKRRVHSTAKTRLKNGPYSHTEEFKEKLSNRNSGNGNPFFGKTHSKEFSKNIQEHIRGLIKLGRINRNGSCTMRIARDTVWFIPNATYLGFTVIRIRCHRII